MSSSTMHLVLVTGMAGAGKSIALRGLEDAGYFCVDNLMPELIPSFARICMDAVHGRDKVASIPPSVLYMEKWT